VTASNRNCPACGKALPPNAKFCVSCGAKVAPETSAKCPHCSRDVPPAAKFCTGCGALLTAGPSIPVPKQTDQDRWALKSGEFASQFEVSDLKGIFSKGVAIKEGTQGLLFQHGEFIDILAPGYHTLQSVTERLLGGLTRFTFESPCAVVLMNASDASLRVTIQPQEGRIQTRDGFDVGVSVQFLVMLKAPLDFYVNLMRDRKVVANQDIVDRISREMTSILQRVLTDYVVEELHANQAVIRRIEDELIKGLKDSFERLGLAFQRIEFVDFSENIHEEIRQKQIALKKKQMEGEVDHQSAEYDQKAELQGRQLELEGEEQHVKLNQKFRELFNEDRVNTIKTQADFEDFVAQVEHEAGAKALLREQEKEQLWRAFEANRQDYQLARQHVLKTLEWQRKRERLAVEFEYKKDLLTKRQDLDDQQRQHQRKIVEEDHRAALEAAYRAHQAELDAVQRERTANRAHAKATADDEFENEKREAEHATRMAAEWQQLENQSADSAVQRELAKQRGEQQIQQEAAQAAHQREQERLELLSSLSVETLIAASPAEQASMIAALKQTEALKGCSEEQILAMAAKDSQAVAEAFAEKYRAAGNQEMYERMLTEQKDAANRVAASEKDASQRMAEVQQEHAKTLAHLMETVLSTQRDANVAAARGQKPAVVFPPAGSQPVSVTPASGLPQATPQGTVICPQCNHHSPQGSQFCGNCGFRFS
jgi:hypothetical protein